MASRAVHKIGDDLANDRAELVTVTREAAGDDDAIILRVPHPVAMHPSQT